MHPRTVSIVLLVILLSAAVGFSQEPAAAPATAPTTRPNSETIGVRISKFIRNPDNTIIAVFDTTDKEQNHIPREVLLTRDTIVNIGGELHGIADIKDEMTKDVVVAMVGKDGRTAVMLRWGRVMLKISKEDITTVQFEALQACAPKATQQSDEAVDKRVDTYVATLHLNAPEREARLKNVLRTNLRAVRDAHNAWLSPSKSVREELNKGLAADLTPEQIDTVKDLLTSQNIQRHFVAYHIIVPGLTKDEDVKIMDLLRQAREEALDVKNVRDFGRAFEPYKKQIENYLISQGHDWKALYKENASKVGQAQSQAVPADPAQ